MPLDDRQKQHIRDTVKWQGGPPRCGLCSQQDWANWHIKEAEVTLRPPQTVGRPDRAVVLICQQCGAMVWLDFTAAKVPPNYDSRADG